MRKKSIHVWRRVNKFTRTLLNFSEALNIVITLTRSIAGKFKGHRETTDAAMLAVHLPKILKR